MEDAIKDNKHLIILGESDKDKVKLINELLSVDFSGNLIILRNVDKIDRKEGLGKFRINPPILNTNNIIRGNKLPTRLVMDDMYREEYIFEFIRALEREKMSVMLAESQGWQERVEKTIEGECKERFLNTISHWDYLEVELEGRG